MRIDLGLQRGKLTLFFCQCFYIILIYQRTDVLYHFIKAFCHFSNLVIRDYYHLLFKISV